MTVEKMLIEECRKKVSGFFHPAFVPLADGALMLTFQTYTSSDCYGSPQFMIYTPAKGWSEPEFIPGMENYPLHKNLIRGIADIRPFVLSDGRVIVFGCSTLYRGDEYADDVDSDAGDQYSVFNIYQPGKGWGACQTLPGIRTACTQLVIADDGSLLLPCYFEYGVAEDITCCKTPRYAVKVLRVTLHANSCEITGESNVLSWPVQRGFIEPSIAYFDGLFYLTIRAEDGYCYVSRSCDPLSWDEPQKWYFDDNSNLQTDSTQQHFINMDDRLFLLYTRNAGYNENVFRFRAPLFIAEVDSDKCCLKKSTEMVALELVEYDGITGLLGNFHVSNLPDGQAFVSDGRMFVRYDETGKEAVRLSELAVAEISVDRLSKEIVVNEF